MAEFGKERAMKMFYWISLLFPALKTAWNFSASSKVNSFSFISKCYGQHDQTFLLEDSVANVAKRPFCTYDDYDEDGIVGVYGPVIYRGSCILSAIVNLALLFNIPDGFIYWRIMAYVKKYVEISFYYSKYLAIQCFILCPYL